MTGLVVATVGILVSAIPPASSTVAVGAAAVPEAEAVAAPEQAPFADDMCLAASIEVEDAALAVEAHRRDSGVELAPRLLRAEVQLSADLDGAEPRLRVALQNMRDAIAGLRHAIESGSRVTQATDAVLDRIDDLATVCQARVRPRSSPAS